MSQPKLDSSQLQKALAAANLHFSLIRKKHPSLKAYLVLSLRGEQTRIDSPLQKMIEDYPALLVDGKPKSRMRKFLSVPLPEKPTPKQKKEWAKRFDDLAEALEFDGKAQVEIRFSNLDYELIWKLQADELVDRELTPQSKASIRIVMGTISHFSESPLKLPANSIDDRRIT
jgi:hypothetical protein